MSINSVSISGNLGRDPELRQTQGGMAILSLTVAVGERRKNGQTGEWEDYTNWVDVTVFGKRAEALSKFLAKGMKVAVTGRLHYRSWEKDGQKRSKLEVNADEVDVMQRRSDGTQSQQAGNYQPQPQSGPQNGSQQPTGYYQQQGDPYDDSIPF